MRSLNARAAKTNKGRGRSRMSKPARTAAPRVSAKAPRRREAEREGRIVRGLRALGNLPLIRRPMLTLTSLLLVAGLAAGILSGGYIGETYAALRDRSLTALASLGFIVREIALDGNERTSADSVYASLDVETGDPIFAADPELLRARLMELPWIADAEVRRFYPDRLSIRLIEKRPYAFWQVGSSVVMVERSGAVIDGAEPDLSEPLPLIIGPGAPELAATILDVLDRQRAVSARLQAVERISERRWDLILDRGIRVRLPETEWEAEVAELERLIVDQGVLERDLEIIDLRFPDSYIFQLHNGDSQPVSRETPV